MFKAESLLQALPVPSCIIGNDGFILNANDEFARAIGYSTKTDVLGSFLGNFLIPRRSELELRPGHWPEQRFRSAVAHAPHVSLVDMTISEIDGDSLRRRVVSLISHGLIHRYDSFRAMTWLTAALVHDLKTPLSAAKMALDRIVVADGLEDELLHLAELGCRALSRTTQIIQNIKDASLEDSASSRWFSLSTVVNDALDLACVMNLAPCAIQKNYDEGLFPVYANASHVFRIVLNLVNNAMQAMGAQRRAHQGLKIRSGQQTGGMAFIDVEDCGPGIAEEERERVFEPYFSTRKSEGGSGLGLAVSRYLARANGGEIIVRSAIGNGTSFRVLLPLVWKAGV